MTVKRALRLITEAPGRAGAVNVLDAEGRLRGIFTDGDLRRRVQSDTGFLDQPVEQVMTADPKRIRQTSLATEAANILKRFRIDELPVVDDDGRLVGIVDVQDLLEVGVF